MKNITNNIWRNLPQELLPTDNSNDNVAVLKFFEREGRRQVRFIGIMIGRCARTRNIDNLSSMDTSRTYQINI